MAKLTTDPFVFEQNTTEDSNSRKLDHTAVLIGRSKERAIGIITTVKDGDQDLKDLATKMFDGDVADLIKLIESTVAKDTLVADAKLLEGADDDELSRLLESRRSDRSKTKSKGLKTSMAVTVGYISAMYAEMMIREFWQKPYNASTNTVFDASDQDALRKKIKSLRSKKCRLAKTAKFVQEDAVELAATEAEIARLNGFRDVATVNSKVILKDVDTEVLRTALSGLDVSTLNAEDQAKLEVLMAKLG